LEYLDAGMPNTLRGWFLVMQIISAIENRSLAIKPLMLQLVHAVKILLTGSSTDREFPVRTLITYVKMKIDGRFCQISFLGLKKI